jgi:hypothetical protein
MTLSHLFRVRSMMLYTSMLFTYFGLCSKNSLFNTIGSSSTSGLAYTHHLKSNSFTCEEDVRKRVRSSSMGIARSRNWLKAFFNMSSVAYWGLSSLLSLTATNLEKSSNASVCGRLRGFTGFLNISLCLTVQNVFTFTL